MGSQGATFAESTTSHHQDCRQVRRKLEETRQQDVCLNFQIGENYYLPMTSYLETKNNPGPSNDLPGPLCFSERIAVHPLSGTSVSVYEDQSLETIKKTRQVITTM